ncbi:MAG: GDP-D-mannose dehydratase [Acidimicrobiales bacterium]|nr:GDP-D-mannose dehydratase [Acidimicrobiales bacterium]
MKVVVTGGAGFIGANVCRTLLAAGHEVVAFDDLSTGRTENLVSVDVSFVEGSILDPEALDATLAGAGSVVHLAARPSVPRSLADPRASHRVNATGTMEVLEAVRRAGGPQVIVASSSSVYGSNPGMPKTEDLVPMPMSPYAASKLATESYALAHAAAFGLDVLAFRFFNVFGPLQPAGHAYAAVVPAFVDAALAGRPLPLQGDGRQTRDFTFVATVAEVIASAVERRVASERPVNLAYGSRVSLLELAELLGKLLGRELEFDFGPARTGDVRDTQADQSRLRSLFPDVEPVDLETGLRATIDWFRATA